MLLCCYYYCEHSHVFQCLKHRVVMLDRCKRYCTVLWESFFHGTQLIACNTVSYSTLQKESEARLVYHKEACY